MKYLMDIKKMHDEIQRKIFLMLPEKWDRLCLYASVIENPSLLQTGEMFFYYFPKGVLRKRPINVYEVPGKFGIDENQYFRLADDLYNSIKKLRTMYIENNEKPWSNLTLIIEEQKYKAIYGYEDLSGNEFDGRSMRIIWAYKYLNEPYESFNKKEREIIDSYSKKTKIPEKIIELPIYIKGVNKKLDNIKTMQKSLEFVTEEKIKEMEFISTHVPKSQILSSK